MRVYSAIIASAVLLAITSLAAADEPTIKVDFQSQVLPLLASKCFECHGPDEAAREADLRLDTRTGVFASGESDRAIVQASDPARSELIRRIASQDDDRMPPPDSGKQLSAGEVALLQRWVEEGAAWSRHWSLVSPQRPKPPRKEAIGNLIDAFVRTELRRRGLEPSAEAEKTTLIRRVTLDLTGLPPTLDEVDAFLADDSPDAYERLVDRLLASPRFGERMAIPWLDASRYADTHGYLFDTQRTMWRWRDWVIASLNRNQPFDEFTIEQLAGDLLPDASEQQKIATGFNRNHLINNEAGAIPAEYLVENVVDRVNTTATVWLGLSLACCQCHDHKYDPFTQRDYYQLYAFFNTLPELGLDGLNTNAKPFMKAPTERDRREFADLSRRARNAEQRLGALGEKIATGQSEWEAGRKGVDHTPRDGLLAHWPFDKSPDDCSPAETKTPTVFEAAEASYSPGILGEAASLEGLAYLNAGDRFNFKPDTPFTFTVWYRPQNKVGRQSIFSRMKNAKSLFRGYTLQTFVGVPAFFMIHSFPDNMIQVQAKAALEPGRWVQLTVTNDGSGKAAGVKLYVNGEVQKPAVLVDKLSEPIDTDAPFWIGNGHPGAKLKGRIDDVRVYDRALTADEIKQLPGLAIDSLLGIATDQRNEEQTRRVRKHYLKHHAPPEWREPYESLEKLKEQVTARERSFPTVMVMQDAKKPKETRMLIRGAYDKPGDKVSAATPAVLPPLDEKSPRNRLGLARWLVEPTHPLTARVTVNRCWQMYFGRGLVATSEDFGVQGEPPSHPQLLDWLAVEFMESGWNVKQLHRRIVTSATYRQTSRMTPKLLDKDPSNRWLARGPRKRLPAELIRDQALAISGLLVSKIGGPSVRPYQPTGLWREVAFDFSGANLTAQIYKQDSGESLYRRSPYTFWKRTAPPPSMLLFDAPDRERCVVRREQTNTPLQALVLMNDPTYVEAARKLAERVMLAEESPQSRVRRAFRLTTARAPTAPEVATLLRLLEKQQERFRGKVELAEELLAVGESKPNESLDRSELAAFTVVANVLLSLDETIAPK